MELAELILTQLIARGTLDNPAGRTRLIYLDLPTAEAAGHFLPCNVPTQPTPTMPWPNILPKPAGSTPLFTRER